MAQANLVIRYCTTFHWQKEVRGRAAVRTSLDRKGWARTTYSLWAPGLELTPGAQPVTPA